ncbi:immunoglobulin-like domain-containing protein [Konateibacter massiliensis]|uniref:immunoglobulin-like domain-containing protein n=1 Tax=Konateibacter massiliensis TaxID=2002841 RepID=UPI000C15BDA2|nr:immunoglobulin-like domain-containing protein [Konateibacter massiliensis]
MNKKILAIVFLCILIIGIFAVFHFITGNKNAPSVVGEGAMELEGVDFTADYEKEYKNLTYTLKNNTDFDIEYGEASYIEIQKNDSWYRVNADDVWIAISYTLSSGDEKTTIVSLQDKLASGNYRLVKFVTVPGYSNQYVVIAYFDVN